VLNYQNRAAVIDAFYAAMAPDFAGMSSTHTIETSCSMHNLVQTLPHQSFQTRLDTAASFDPSEQQQWQYTTAPSVAVQQRQNSSNRPQTKLFSAHPLAYLSGKSTTKQLRR
jgi:hypothetical protein